MVEDRNGETELDVPRQVLVDDGHTLVARHQSAADSTRKPDLFASER